MKLVFYTDPHLNLTRTSHTTPKSSTRLRTAVFDQVKTIVSEASKAGSKVVCLGDLFDTYSNPEWALLQAVEILGKTDLVLAGNHDVRNHADSVGSLQLLDQFMEGKIILNKWGDTEPSYTDIGRTRLIMIPHLRSQEDFGTALNEAVELARDSFKWNVLCLHCNIEIESMDSRETTLNLSADMIKHLLGIFHLIVTGHEHKQADLYGGRLIRIGNTHPTGFNDICDKRTMIYDTEECKVEFVTHWEQEKHYWSGPISALEYHDNLQFIDLVDDMPEPGAAFRAVADIMSKPDGPYAVRLRATEAANEQSPELDLTTISKLPDIIRDGIKSSHPELTDLWEELLNASETITA